MSFLKLVLSLNKEHKTGVLKIKQDQLQKSLYFKNGNIIYVDSSLRAENLGRLLVDRKKITEEQFEKVVKMVSESGKRQGEVLVELGFLTPYDVFEALKAQLAQKILNCFMLKDFTHEFLEGLKHLENITELPVNLHRILIDGVQSSYTFDILKEEGGFSKDTSPLIRPESRPLLNSLELRSEETKLTRLFDGKNLLFNIAKDSEIDPQFVLSTVYVLNALGILEYASSPIRKIYHKLKPPVPADDIASEKPKTQEIIESMKKSRPEKEEKPKETPPPLENKIANKDSPIYPLYLKLDTQGYLELFGLSVKFKKEDLKKNYDSIIKKYNLEKIEECYKGEEKEMAEKIWNKMITAYTILKDEKKRDEYLKMRSKMIKPKSPDEDNVLKAEIEATKAAIYKKKNNFQKAEEFYRNAVELNPNELDYILNLADTVMNRAVNEKADVPKEVEELLKKALSTDQNNFNAFLNLGLYYKFLGEFTKASNCFNKSVEINPTNSRANAELRLLTMRGSKDKKPSMFSSFFTKKPKKGDAAKKEEKEEDDDKEGAS